MPPILSRTDRMLTALSKPLLWRDLCARPPASWDAEPPLADPRDVGSDQPDAESACPLRVLYAEDNATNRLVFGKMVGTCRWN